MKGGAEGSDNNCPICLEEMSEKNKIKTECGHTFHAHCLAKSGMDFSEYPSTDVRELKRNTPPVCPLCRGELTDDFIKLDEIIEKNKIVSDEYEELLKTAVEGEEERAAAAIARRAARGWGGGAAAQPAAPFGQIPPPAPPDDDDDDSDREDPGRSPENRRPGLRETRVEEQIEQISTIIRGFKNPELDRDTYDRLNAALIEMGFYTGARGGAEDLDGFLRLSRRDVELAKVNAEQRLAQNEASSGGAGGRAGGGSGGGSGAGGGARYQFIEAENAAWAEQWSELARVFGEPFAKQAYSVNEGNYGAYIHGSVSGPELPSPEPAPMPQPAGAGARYRFIDEGNGWVEEWSRLAGLLGEDGAASVYAESGGDYSVYSGGGGGGGSTSAQGGAAQEASPLSFSVPTEVRSSAAQSAALAAEERMREAQSAALAAEERMREAQSVALAAAEQANQAAENKREAEARRRTPSYIAVKTYAAEKAVGEAKIARKDFNKKKREAEAAQLAAQAAEEEAETARNRLIAEASRAAEVQGTEPVETAQEQLMSAMARPLDDPDRERLIADAGLRLREEQDGERTTAI